MKQKKVRFTEPPKDDSSASHILSSDPLSQQRSPVNTRSRAARHQVPSRKPIASALDHPDAQDSNAGEGFQTAQPSVVARTRSAKKARTTAPQKELISPVPDEADQCCNSDKQKCSIAARTRAAGTSPKQTCTKQSRANAQLRAEDDAAMTRSASTPAAVTTGRAKRKQPAADEEERCPAAKRVRAGKAGSDVPTTGSTAPHPRTATAQAQRRQGKPAKCNQRPARAASRLAKDRTAGLNKMH